jgi:N-formylglutamate deformylase
MPAKPPLSILAPTIEPIALVCDSPHSGTDYPDDFDYAADLADLRRCEDTHVDALWSGVPQVGGVLLQAHFPRSYIDTNRACTDIEAGLLDAPWPGELHPSDRCTRLGNGLIYSKTTTLAPIYARQLGVDEVLHRIEHYWKPYRDALQTLIERTRARHGRVWHLNLHSMPSNAYERLGLPGDRALADVVLGDLRGRTCAPAFTHHVAEAFAALGYTVAINDPYVGQDLVRAHGRPDQGCESLQIELNRRLYLDEATRECNSRFERTRQDIDRVLRAVAHFVIAEVGACATTTSP